MTAEPKEVKIFQKIVREVAFIAIEERENIQAHHLLTTYASANAVKYIDYLVSNTPDLESYKPSIRYKSIVLPVMQRKVEKKQQPQVQQQQPKVSDKPQKTKAKIFDREEEAARPAPNLPPPKKREEPQDTGFSPYENTKQPEPVQPVAKKNLNTPPPPPISHKKPVHVQEEEYEREVPPPPPQQPLKVQQPPKKNPPPPPPVHQTPSHQAEDETAHRPNVVQKPIPVQPVVSEKKTPPPPPAVHKPPPPPPPVHRQ